MEAITALHGQPQYQKRHKWVAGLWSGEMKEDVEGTLSGFGPGILTLSVKHIAKAVPHRFSVRFHAEA